MTRPVPIKIPAGREAVVRQLFAPHVGLDALDGTVPDAGERQVLAGGRDLQLRLTRAVARRGRRKMGPRSAPASAAWRGRSARAEGAVAVDADTVRTRKDGWRNLKSAMIS